ncbi:MAG: DUF3887 domain-containing protein [Desulfuromonadaceae bacterium]|nr:DUF3887 domain-containing protein [Desulfuromonadaceae bacterium]MDD5106942.1 DUF3887 domain-containing protein [Desulfuromonadaceae bacterium]
MNYLRLIKTVFMLVVLVTFIGCNAKQDKPVVDNGAAPQQNQTDARSAAAHVLAQLEAGDFTAIYKEASAGFKKIGSEQAFVTKFQQTMKRVGVLKTPKEVSFETKPDKGHILVYSLENENYKTEIRLTFTRDKNGKMELAGLNQHDELRKK